MHFFFKKKLFIQHKIAIFLKNKFSFFLLMFVIFQLHYNGYVYVQFSGGDAELIIDNKEESVSTQSHERKRRTVAVQATGDGKHSLDADLLLGQHTITVRSRGSVKIHVWESKKLYFHLFFLNLINAVQQYIKTFLIIHQTISHNFLYFK